MPKRVLDFDAMWGSDKLASCAEWAQAEYAWLYGLADASGCFELTNLRVIWGRVAAIRTNLTIERLEQIFGEFRDKGLLFAWEHEGKRYGHWTGSDVPGRLPPPSWRMRLERLAPPVPKLLFAEYVARFARGRAGLPGGGFRAATEQGIAQSQFEISNLKSQSSPAASAGASGGLERRTGFSERLPANSISRPPSEPGRAEDRGGLRSLKDGLEEAHAQDWNWNQDREKGREGSRERLARRESPDGSGNAGGRGEPEQARSEMQPSLFSDLNSNSETWRAAPPLTRVSADENRSARAGMAGVAPPAWAFRANDKAAQVARELAVGQGPCGPVKVKPEALERIRARDAARRGSRP